MLPNLYISKRSKIWEAEVAYGCLHKFNNCIVDKLMLDDDKNKFIKQLRWNWTFLQLRDGRWIMVLRVSPQSYFMYLNKKDRKVLKNYFDPLIEKDSSKFIKIEKLMDTESGLIYQPIIV